MNLAGLEGRDYPPAPIDNSPARVAAFIEATGDDPDRWAAHAPPSFAAAALFALVPDLLAEPELAGGSIIHSDQSFRYRGPLTIDEPLAIEGTVEAVRSRGPLHFVTFNARAGDWLEAGSTFVISDQAPVASDDEGPEPAPTERGVSQPPAAASLPAPGEPLGPLAKSASRLDLVRYAAASGDFNPIHWDHPSAISAGLPGVIVHGLLMSAWISQAACRVLEGVAPIAQIDARFRRLLRPAVAAVVEGTVEGVDPVKLDLALVAGGERLVTASVVGGG